MSTPEMNSPPANRSREVAQGLFQKNLELEEARRKAAKLKIPSDPNAWSQMRDNFEAIILEDHDFSEKHGVEYSLWQLHHRRIDEYRSHLSASQNGKLPSRPDRTKKIFSSFKGFLSEASGFYHDLILKIRSKYGLPLGYFTEGIESEAILSKDTKKSADMKKALLSCHRCLIFLGDLARYKGMYGEGESASRDYAAASSYYLQAASLWPSSGNPHHQLAILSICTDENEITTIYRYFRSLAVENPLLTARDNLIVAFEKNRQKCSQLPMDSRTNPPKIKMNGRGRGYTENLSKSVNPEDVPIKERELNISEVFSAFCLRFVRLNGILYTRTSLETFSEIFSSALTDLLELLSTGPEEKVNFGADATNNGMFFLKLVSILIFSVYNVNKESENQSYAGILQRSVLLQNAFTATFEFMGHIVRRCTESHDATSSYLLPAILVFIEWLACNPDIASGIDSEEKQTLSRSLFWTHFVSLMNKLLLTGFAVSSGEEDSCFFDMRTYDEGDTENRLALWEDFELRGFVPLVPAQIILKFSGNHSYIIDGSTKEKKSRVQRILAAGKELTNVVTVDQKKIYFDSKTRGYVLSEHPPVCEDEALDNFSELPKSNSILNHSKAQLSSEGEEDEVIVFKPTVFEKPSNNQDLSSDCDAMKPFQAGVSNIITPPPQNYSANWESYLGPPFSSPLEDNPKMSLPVLSAPESSAMMNPLLVTALQQPFQALPGVNSTTGILQPPFQHINPNTNWGTNQDVYRKELGRLSLTDRGMWGGLPSMPVSGPTISDQVNSVNSWSMAGGSIVPPAVSSSSRVSAVSWRAPVSRPVRHLGPPPGFNSVPFKQIPMGEQISLVDDYSWLDGYSSVNNGSVNGNSFNNSANGNLPPLVNTSSTENSNHNGALSFPFPGKQPQSLWSNYHV